MKILVTGATGFVGTHLMELLRSQPEAEVYGTSMTPYDDPSIRQIDLTDAEAVRQLLDELKPDQIYHLAAFASPALSFKQPVEAITSTIVMQLNLFESCQSLGLKPRILVVSSGQNYGKVEKSDLPVEETRAFDYASPYAVAKAAQENLATLYSKLGLECVVARPFNHIGPGQQPGYLVPDLCKQIAEIEAGSAEPVIKVGNLTSKRDFTDVRDVVRAYLLLMEHGKAGEVYNVCSGRSVAGQRVLDTLLELASKDIRVEQDPERMRPSDIEDLYGDFTKIHEHTGWERKISLKQTLRDTLDYWQQKSA